MKQSIGTTYVIAFVVIFLAVTFAFLLGIMSYMKAFKINSGMLNAIENNEGYNRLAQAEITRHLQNAGYRVDSNNTRCPEKNGVRAQTVPYGGTRDNTYRYCIYEYPPKGDTRYFRYGVTTYISLSIPVVGDFLELPVYTESEKIYEFPVLRK